MKIPLFIWWHVLCCGVAVGMTTGGVESCPECAEGWIQGCSHRPEGETGENNCVVSSASVKYCVYTMLCRGKQCPVKMTSTCILHVVLHDVLNSTFTGYICMPFCGLEVHVHVYTWSCRPQVLAQETRGYLFCEFCTLYVWTKLIWPAVVSEHCGEWNSLHTHV